jgi:hypothetical protein
MDRGEQRQHEKGKNIATVEKRLASGGEEARKSGSGKRSEEVRD